jgi:hypothetical protein
MSKEDELIFLTDKKEELKKELQYVNKRLRQKKSYEYIKKEENLKYCKYCDKKISKYAFKKHEKTEKHILKKNIYEKLK